jgi:hypothetical protein
MKIPSWESFKDECSALIIDKKRRYVLIAGAVLLFCGLAFWLFPYLERIQGGETGNIAAQKKRVAKYQQTVKGRGELEGRLVSLNKSLERAEAGLLTGKTAALAAVDIQNTLNEIVIGSGVEIKSVQVMKSQNQNQKQDANLYISIPVQFTVSATIRQLKDILYKIEASSKFFLTVERIGISVSGAGGPGQMRCDITVSGIMKNVKE